MEHLHTFRADGNIVDFYFSPTNRNIIYAITGKFLKLKRFLL